MENNLIIPQLDQFVSSDDLVKLTHLKRRFWEQRRYSGDSPPFIKLSDKCVRYRWGDVVHWLEQKKRTSTSDQGKPPASDHRTRSVLTQNHPIRKYGKKPLK